MNFNSEHIYHIYNRSIQGLKLFYTRENYIYFLRKVKVGLNSHCHFLAYCLMPTHFHLLVHIKVDCSEKEMIKSIAILQRSYTQAINKQNQKKGSLFQQHCKAKCVSIGLSETYPLNCFLYIHQNPKLSYLVDKIEDWEFSSFKDYLGLRDGTLCSQQLAKDLLNFPDGDEFYELSYSNLRFNPLEEML